MAKNVIEPQGTEEMGNTEVGEAGRLDMMAARPSMDASHPAPESKEAEQEKGLKKGRMKILNAVRAKVERLFAKRVVSLYVDDTTIKFVVAKGKNVERWDVLELEPGLISNGVISDTAKVGAQIKGLFEKHSVQSKKAIVGLSGLHSLSRIITLPYLQGGDLHEAVKREAERELPMPIEDIYLSWQVVHAAGDEMKVFVVAYARNVIESLIVALRGANIKLRIMDLAPIALTRVVNKQTSTVFDVRPSELDIVTIIDGVPELIRSLPLSRDKSLEEKLPIIREELERTIRFYKSERSVNGGFSVFGSGELETAMLESLSSDGYKIIPSLPSLNYPPDFAPRNYMVNLGLILRTVTFRDSDYSPLVNLNALPTAYWPPDYTGKILRAGAILSAVVLIIAGAMFLRDMRAKTTDLRNSLDVTNTIVNQRQTQQVAITKQIGEIQKKIVESSQVQSTFAAALTRMANDREMVNGDLRLAIESLPFSLTLTSLKYGDGLTVNGKAPSDAEVLAYARKLYDSKRFSEVVIASLQDDPNSPVETPDTTFSVVLRRGA